MQVRLAAEEDKEKWDKLVVESSAGSFMQSWAWGDMQAKFGLPIWRLVVEDEDELIGVALVLQREVSFGRSWLYIPRGPVFNGDPKVWRLLNDKLREIGEGRKAIFMRADPSIPHANGNDVLMIQGGWQKCEREVQPRHTLVLDLSLSEEDLLAGMHAKTRYNVRLAERKGVGVRFSSEKKDMDGFLKLTREVQGRGHFHFHPDKYYRVMREVLGKEGTMEMAVAEYEGEVIVVHLLISFGDVMTYVHGASGSVKREMMAPHLLQWESIKRAKSKGMERYDFFGVAPERGGEIDKAHPWAGITRFKLGFGGEQVNYIGAYDLILDPTFYAIYNVARRMKGALR